jgi:hypothetical protein
MAASRTSGAALACTAAADAPTMPQEVQTIRGAKAGTGTASSNASTFMTASWWQSSQVKDGGARRSRACWRVSSAVRGGG